MNNSRPPVLILGLGRSGSKLVQQILNHNKDVYIGPELNFYCVFKDDLLKQVRAIGNLKTEGNIERVVDLVYSQQIQKVYAFTRPIPKESLRELLLNGERTERGVFEGLIRSRAKVEKGDADIAGVKFPFHFSFIQRALEWYPDGRIVFLLRDPRAILASELRKKTQGRSVSSGFPKYRSLMVQKAAITIYVLVSAYWYYRVVGRYKDLDNVYILKYENLILSPESTVRDLCDFLQIGYMHNMTEVSLRDSSFETRRLNGFTFASLQNWKRELGNGPKFLVRSLLGSFLKEYGYQ